MFGSCQAMVVLRRNGSQGAIQPTVVAGPLCESGDVFTQGDGGVVLPRDLPAAQVGDLLVIHDTGAYGASMSSNYNTRPLVAEVLAELARLNDEYERRFGFEFVVFVNGRTRAELLPVLRERLRRTVVGEP